MIFPQAIVHFSVAFSIDASDESPCANHAQKRTTYIHDDPRNHRYRQAAAVAPQGEQVAPEKAPAKKGAPKAKETAKGKPGPKAKAAAPRAESKGAKILDMIARAKGATLAEIMKTTDWQAHSVRGFISTGGKKHGVKIESAKNDSGERTYKIPK